MKLKLSRNTLKLIAVIAMLVDHISYLFLDELGVIGISLRFIGRITYPIMAFMLVEGYYHTKDYTKYLFRMFGISVISCVACAFFSSAWIPFSAVVTLFLGLIVLGIYNSEIKLDMKMAYIFIILCLSILCEYSLWGVMLILLFAVFRNKKSLLMLSYLVMIVIQVLLNINDTYLIQFGLLLVIPLILLYDGKKSDSKVNKLYYYFYPIHLVVLKLIELML